MWTEWSSRSSCILQSHKSIPCFSLLKWVSLTGINRKNHKGFVDLFYNFWIQKSHHFYGFCIQNFICPFLQFLDPETSVFLQFLDSETAPFLQILDPEISWSIFIISGSRNCSIFAVSYPETAPFL